MLKRLLRQRATKKIIRDGENRSSQEESLVHLKKSVAANLDYIKKSFSNSFDLKTRTIELDGRPSAVAYIDVLVNKEQVQDLVLRALLSAAATRPEVYRQGMVEAATQVLPMGEVTAAQDMTAIIDGLTNGAVIWLLDGEAKALVIDVKGWVTRPIIPPETEVGLRGSREGLTENLVDNIAMLRRRLRVPELVTESYRLGTRSQTQICVVYLKGICREELVAEVRLRLQRIKIDAVLESNYIEEFIQDTPYTPFPLVGNVEKPDILAAKLLEGRVGIIVDGTPMVLTVPKLFVECFQTADDYYQWPLMAISLRSLRYLAFFLSVTLPAFFVAILNFHQEMVPTPLLITIAASREGTPFPALVEVLLMLTLLYIVVEASLRMPRTLGQTVSIVGTLVIGQAAISSGLVGAPVVIVMTASALTAFLAIPLLAAGTMTRLALLLGAGFLGLYGMVMVTLVIIIHLCALESFKTPYLFPVAPLSTRGLKDTLIRAPWPSLRTRPWVLAPDDTERQPRGQYRRLAESRGRRKT